MRIAALAGGIESTKVILDSTPDETGSARMVDVRLISGFKQRRYYEVDAKELGQKDSGHGRD